MFMNGLLDWAYWHATFEVMLWMLNEELAVQDIHACVLSRKMNCPLCLAWRTRWWMQLERNTIGKKMQCCSRPVLLRQCVLEQQLTMVEASELKHWQAGEDSWRIARTCWNSCVMWVILRSLSENWISMFSPLVRWVVRLKTNPREHNGTKKDAFWIFSRLRSS